MRSIFHAFVEETIYCLENCIHYRVMIQLDQSSESNSQVNLDLVNESLDALHYQICPLLELVPSFEHFPKLHFVAIKLA